MRALPRLSSHLQHLSHGTAAVRRVSTCGSAWGLETAWKEAGAKAASAFENAMSPGGAWSEDNIPDQTGKTFLVKRYEVQQSVCAWVCWQSAFGTDDSRDS